MRGLHGKRVLVTGAGRGIGRELALRFAERGAHVVLADLDAEALADAVDTVRSRGVEAMGVTLDVTNVEAVLAARERIHAEGGPLDIVVNNAGVVFGGPFLEVGLDRHLLTYRVNILGPVTVTHAFLPDLIKRPEGHLVNLASASGYLALPFAATYASSKWAVIGFSDSIRKELELLGHRHVRVTAVCPSYVGTGLFEGASPPRLTRMLEPGQLAERIVRAVLRGRRVVRTPWLVKVTPFLKGILPAPLFEAVAGALGATGSMRRWRGRP